jgi:hypothetical protein
MPVNMLPVPKPDIARMAELDRQIDWRTDVGFRKTLVKRKPVASVVRPKVVQKSFPIPVQQSLFPPRQERIEDLDFIEVATYFNKYSVLRKAGAFDGIILLDEGRWYISHNIYDVWSEKERTSYQRFKGLVEEAEALYNNRGDHAIQSDAVPGSERSLGGT